MNPVFLCLFIQVAVNSAPSPLPSHKCFPGVVIHLTGTDPDFIDANVWK